MPEQDARDSSRPRHPGVPFPPPFLFVAGFLAGLALERWGWRIPVAADGLRALLVFTGWLGVIAGLLLAGWASWCSSELAPPSSQTIPRAVW